MNDLRAVLVDDERLAREELSYLLGQLGGVEVIGQAGDGLEAVDTIDRLQPDLVFLDVQMPGLTGFDVARRMVDLEAGAQIVFVTAFDSRAIEAFEVNAVDYLLKPVDPARLDTAVQRVRRRIALERSDSAEPPSSAIAPDQIERLVRLVSERQARREQVAVKVGDRLLLAQAEDIVCASMADETITIVTSHYTGTSNYRTLDDLHARLDPGIFWRVHRSHIVNINQIKEIVPWFSRNYILRMKDEKASEIPVSRTQTRRLREYLKI